MKLIAAHWGIWFFLWFALDFYACTRLKEKNIQIEGVFTLSLLFGAATGAIHWGFFGGS